MAVRPRWLLLACVTLACAVDERTPGIAPAAGGNTNTPQPALPEGDGRGVTLSVVVRGDGLGSISVVRDDHPDQLCLEECNTRVASGTELRLTATPGLNTALRWSVPGCGSERTCQLRVDSDLMVEATLELAYNVAFITSQRYTVPELPSPGDAANRECARLAAAAGLHGTRFVAWLAAPGTRADADDDITPSRGFQHRGGWVRPDGEPIARSVASLTRGELLHPLQLDENGVVQPSATPAWSAVTTAGALTPEATLGAVSCRNWSSSDARDQGGIALSSTTYIGEGFAGVCSGSNRMMCFGDDSDAELPAAPLTGRLAFLSQAFFNAGTGLATADALCQNEACAAGLTGSTDCASNPGSTHTFKAYLHTSTQAAWQRFDLSGPNWLRLDGIPWLPAAASLGGDAKDRVTGLTVHADGSYAFQGVAWVGNQTGDNCRDWSSTSSDDRSATTGPDTVDRRGLGGANSTQCGYNRGLVLCLEE
jgi:hypothetical protein